MTDTNTTAPTFKITLRSFRNNYHPEVVVKSTTVIQTGTPEEMAQEILQVCKQQDDLLAEAQDQVVRISLRNNYDVVHTLNSSSLISTQGPLRVVYTLRVGIRDQLAYPDRFQEQIKALAILLGAEAKASSHGLDLFEIES